MYLRYLPNNNIEYMIFLAFSCIGKSWLETTKEPNRELVFRLEAPRGDQPWEKSALLCILTMPSFKKRRKRALIACFRVFTTPFFHPIIGLLCYWNKSINSCYLVTYYANWLLPYLKWAKSIFVRKFILKGSTFFKYIILQSSEDF